jgi:hypothetical protein
MNNIRIMYKVMKAGLLLEIGNDVAVGSIHVT